MHVERFGIQQKLPSLLFDFRDAALPGRVAQKRHLDKPLDALRRVAVAVDQFVRHIERVFLAADVRDAPVHLEPAVVCRDIPLGDMRLDLQIQQALGLLRPLLALFLRDRIAEQLQIEVVADGLHVAVLFAAEQAPRAADLEVAHRNLKARTEFRKFPDCRKALLCDFRKDLIRRKREIGVRAPGASADAPADLVELRKS